MQNSPQKFSVHPRLAAVIDLLLNGATFWLLPQLSSWYWFGLWFAIRVVLWGLFIRLVYYPKELSRWRHFLSLVFFNFGVVVALLIFVEWRFSWYLLSTAFILFSAVSFWLLPTGEDRLMIFSKSYRRWLFLMDAFGLAGFWSGVYAFLSFQLIPHNYFWLMALVGAAVTAIISSWWWRAYGLEYTSRFWLSLIVCFVLMFELAAVIWTWPLGYRVNGIIMIWFWYNLWLIIRFNLTKEGIDWKKQRVFFALNILLFVIFLFSIKWV